MTSDIIEDIICKTVYGVFKREETLFREYIPKQLPRREKELERISRDFRPILKEKNFPVNIVLSGKSGVGKTVLAKFFCEKLINFAKSRDNKIEYQYCNCYIYRSKSAILYHLLSKLYNATCRGFEPETLLLDLHNRLKRENKRLILILDEVHIFGDEILFFLQFSEPNIHYILISRDLAFKQILNVNLSGKLLDHIKLEGYSKNDLIEILNFRTIKAFKPGTVSSEIIDMIAEIAALTQNARHAIEIIYNAGKIADCNNKKIITPDAVREAKNYIFPETSSKILKTLKKGDLLVLLAVARSLLIKDFTNVKVKLAYSNFKVVCEEFNLKLKSQNVFTKSIKRLIDLGFIIQLNNKFNTSQIQPLRITLHDVPAQILEQKLIKLLKTNKI